MPYYPLWRNGRIVLHQETGHLGESLVLGVGKTAFIGALQLYADGKFIAIFPPFEAGLPGMPGFLIKRHILGYISRPVDQEVSGNPQRGDLGKVRMAVRIQAIAEQLINMITTKLTRRETDIVNNQQAYFTFR
jgi:hypothetical protein